MEEVKEYGLWVMNEVEGTEVLVAKFRNHRDAMALYNSYNTPEILGLNEYVVILERQGICLEWAL